MSFDARAGEPARFRRAASIEMEAKPLVAPRPRDLSLASDKAVARLGCPLPSLMEGLARLRLLEEAGWPAQLAAAVGGPR